MTFVLAQPGKESYHANLNYDDLMNKGDSLLLLPKDVSVVKVEIFNEKERVEALFSANSRGALATGQIRLLASGFSAAEQMASDLLLPRLSWWSYRFDVAIDIAGYQVVEENTGVVRYAFGHLGKERGLVLTTEDEKVASTPEYRALLAAYREAGNATNPFYQFLCYYRVTEGVQKLRAKRRSVVLGANKAYREPSERFPKDVVGHPLWRDIFSPFCRKKFTWALDGFRDLVRNAVAHLDPTANTLVADESQDLMKCESAIPVIKYIARAMPRNDLMADFGISASAIPD